MNRVTLVLTKVLTSTVNDKVTNNSVLVGCEQCITTHVLTITDLVMRCRALLKACYIIGNSVVPASTFHQMATM